MTTMGPISRTAELAVLGAVLSPQNGTHAYDAIAGTVRAEDFAEPLHALAWRSVESLTEAGRPASVLDVAEHLDAAHPELSPVLPTLGPIVRELPSAANVVLYAERVAQSARARRLMHALDAGSRRLAGARRGGELAQLCDDVLSDAVSAYDAQACRGGAVTAKDAVTAMLEAIDDRYQRVGKDMVDGLHTGFPSLDRKTGGFRPGELIVIGARPSVGKTSLAMNIAAHVAAATTVAVYSLEMPVDQIMLRLFAAHTRLPLQAVRTGQIDDAGCAAMARAAAWIEGIDMHIDDDVGLTALDIAARSRRIARQHGLGLIVVDYLQLLRMTGENRTRAVGEATLTLKNAAKTLGVPVLLVSQLNRETTRRGGKPTLADLRDSGEIEQHADVVGLVHRDDAANPDEKSHDGKGELIIAKARNGEIGTVGLRFTGHACLFTEAHDDTGSGPAWGYGHG